MPKYRITSPEGKTFEINAPDGATPDQVIDYAQKQFAAMPTDALKDQLKTAPSKEKGGVAGGLFMGAIRDPLDAGAQLLPRALSKITSLGGYAPNGVSQFFDDEAGRVDGIVKTANAEYDQSRQLAAPDTVKSLVTGQKDLGTDWARLAGNVVSPANAAIAARIPLSVAKTGIQMALRGSAAGAAGATLQPVLDTDNFATEKAKQVGIGAAGGAILTPILSKIGNVVAQKVADYAAQRRPVSLEQVDQMIAESLKREGVDFADVTQDALGKMRQQAADALKTRQNYDPAAALRKQDFDRLDIQGTSGQIGRDPSQYTRERNLSATEAGKALKDRFSEQNNKLMTTFDRLGAGKAVEPYEGGNALINALRASDAPAEQQVSNAYRMARAADGRHANVDVPGFSRAANNALDAEMLGTALPDQARSLLNKVSAGEIPLNVNTLVQFDKRLSGMQRDLARQGNGEGALAIGKVRDALNSADIDSSAGQGAKAAFDEARTLARQRFAKIESTPALKAALDGAQPDDFVRKYLIQGKADEVKNLANVLQGSPDALEQARAQVVAYLKQKAYGANAAGDGNIGQSTFNNTMAGIPTDKLKALFSEAEIADLKSLGRVAAYINQRPAGSAVNESNTAGAVMNMLSNFSGKMGALPVVNLGRDSLRTFRDERFAQNALAGSMPGGKESLSPEATNRLMRLLGPASVGVGAASAPRN